MAFNRGNVRKTAFRSRGRSAQSLDVSGPRIDPSAEGDGRLFLQIKPAITDPRHPFAQRSHSTLTGVELVHRDDSKDSVIDIQAVGEGKVQLARTPQEKDRLPDRISLDRRGLSSIPHIIGEPSLRLLSLQHNLINSLSGLLPLDLGKLVFLDVYDNQIDKINALERLFSLRVLLMGKNRIRRIEGLANLIKLEVLDLHGNRIGKVSGLSTLSELKVLNLAGNQIKSIGVTDLQGLISLKEINLKRNRLRKLLGFQNTPKLEKVYLGNNDLQSVEDMSSLADAPTLIDISLEGNPVALGGDCTPFLVSYLPNLLTLTNMHVTTQVRQAAMAWRDNKEAAHAAYCALEGTTQQEARRDQIINNARTNWELLRTENKCFINVASTTQSVNIDKEIILESATTNSQSATQIVEEAEPNNTIPQVDTDDSGGKINNDNTNKTKEVKSASKPSTIKKVQRSSTARKPSERRVNFSDRSVSQDTDASHSTSTSSDLRLPPILLPIISSLENVKLIESVQPMLRRWESISSLDPVADSSLSSLPSSTSESEEESSKRPLRRMPTALRRREKFTTMRSKSVCDPVNRRIQEKHLDSSENASNISNNTNFGSVGTSSTSGSDHTRKMLRREGSLSNRQTNRNIKSATTVRKNERASSASRASSGRVKSGKSLASFKTSEPVPKPMSVCKDREQGVDYLVEVSNGVVNAWGAGSIRRLARDWDWEKVRTVTRANFHYIHFNAIAQSLPELKNKFPNVTHISVRATGLQWLGQIHALAELRGITGVTLLAEGNPIHTKNWREYTIYRLAHWGLKEVNEEQVTDEEIRSANQTYNGLSDLVLRALPDAPLQPLLSRLGKSGHSSISAKAWLRAADPALRDVIAKEALQYKKSHVSQEDMSWRVRGQGHLSHAIELACGAALRLRILELQWPNLLVEMIEDILRDFCNIETHVKEQMRLLMDTL